MTLKKLGDQEILVFMHQYKIEFFPCCLRLLPFHSSTFHQIRVENSQIRSENNLSVSRIQSPDLLVGVILRVEEEFLVFLLLGTLDRIELLVQCQSIFFLKYENP